MTPEDSNVYPIDVRSTNGRQHLRAVGHEVLTLSPETTATDIMISYARRTASALGLPWDENNDDEVRLFVQCVIEAASSRATMTLDALATDLQRLIQARTSPPPGVLSPAETSSKD